MIVDGQRVDLEIQVKDEHDYPERSLYYWARQVHGGTVPSAYKDVRFCEGRTRKRPRRCPASRRHPVYAGCSHRVSRKAFPRANRNILLRAGYCRCLARFAPWQLPRKRKNP
ncbi:MAG: Rpn family recombination-promoting nuclease/putative transposase [Spirochaetota bacterium]|nr:Rpn family recombination-promoting nuclease/putative transposase [Spirochaetota bacterium]